MAVQVNVLEYVLDVVEEQQSAAQGLEPLVSFHVRTLSSMCASSVPSLVAKMEEGGCGEGVTVCHWRPAGIPLQFGWLFSSERGAIRAGAAAPVCEHILVGAVDLV